VTHHLDTLLVHTGSAGIDPATGSSAVSVPPVRASTVRFANLDALEQAQRRKMAGERVATYGRSGMETHRALEDVFVQLEGGAHCTLAPCGMAAITLVFMSLLQSGDHALVADCVYGPVLHLDSALLRQLNIEITYFTPGRDDPEPLIRQNTRLLYVESPGSLLFQMLDMPALAEIARRRNIVLATDNTWGSGYIYRPLDLGAQISVVAGTKYVAGHSDVMLGAVVTNDAELGARLTRIQYAMGYAVGPDDAWLALRGVRTMAVRMAQHGRNALKMCEFLERRPEVARVYHPALPSDPGHALWRRDCTGSNGMLAIELRLSHRASRAFVDALTLFGIGYSWGGYESLVQWVEPSSLATHGYWQGGDHAVVRMHVGLESPDDLIADVAQALDRAAAA